VAHIDCREREMFEFLAQIANMDSGPLDKNCVDRVGAVLADGLELVCKGG